MVTGAIVSVRDASTATAEEPYTHTYRILLPFQRSGFLAADFCVSHERDVTNDNQLSEYHVRINPELASSHVVCGHDTGGHRRTSGIRGHVHKSPTNPSHCR